MNITPLRPYQTGVKKVSAVDRKSFYTTIGALAEEARQPAEQTQNVDRLDISGTAQRSEVEKTAWTLTQQAAQPTAAQRIDSLRAAVQSRTYSVPASEIADAMVSSWRML